MKISKKNHALFGGVFDLDGLEKQITEKEQLTSAPDFWDDATKANAIYTEISHLKNKVQPWRELIEEIKSVSELIDMYKAEDDGEIQEEIQQSIKSIIICR